MALILMGVSGSGKSTVGIALAQKLGLKFYDADDYHSDANKSKMANGIPLVDEDRWEWLSCLRKLIVSHAEEGIVLACSALRRCYRDILSGRSSGYQKESEQISVIFIHLHGSADTVSSRMSQRRHHFMPQSLLLSQYQTLESLEPDEAGFQVTANGPIDDLVIYIYQKLHSTYTAVIDKK